jgi:uncharacterized protein (TIGR03437 family)
VDLLFYGSQGELEFDFVVAPGADPNNIRLAFMGQQGLRVDEEGTLRIAVSGDAGNSELRLNKPVVYQDTARGRVEIAGNFLLHESGEVGFALAAYDRSRPLVVDPVLAYSTFFGGAMEDLIGAVAVDAGGSIYVTGATDSADFPTATPLQPTKASDPDTFVAKLNSAGSALLYSTYLGGTGVDQGLALAVDAAGTAFVAGGTDSTDFPTMNPLQAANGGQLDGFVSRLNASGSALLYSTYLGGAGEFGEFVNAIALDAAGAAHLTGITDSPNFPVTTGAYDRTLGLIDAFITKLNPTGTALVYSTFLGGFGLAGGNGIAVDSSGSAYVAGVVIELIRGSFPVLSAFQAVPGGGTCAGLPCSDAFVTKLNLAGSALVYSTMLGGNGDDEALDIDADSGGSAYVTGYATSTDFPVTNALQPVKGAGFDAFVARLNPDGMSLAFSTFMGGGGAEAGEGIALGPPGIAYVTGYTGSNAFPVLNALQQFRTGNFEAFVAAISSIGGLIYSSYLGGINQDIGEDIAADAQGTAFVAGQTRSPGFPTINAFQPAYRQGTCGEASELFDCDDGFITRITNPNAAPVLTSLAPASAGTGGAAFHLTVNGSNFAGNSEVRWNGAARPTSFSTSSRLIAAVSAGDIANAGTAQITVFTPAPGGGVSGALSFDISSSGAVPAFIASSLVNGGSFSGLAPGVASIASLFGTNLSLGTALASSLPLPTSLSGTSVRLNNILAPLFFVSPGQINLQIPWELMGLALASLTVTVDGVANSSATVNLPSLADGTHAATSAPVTVGVSPLAPSIFSVNSQGTGQGAVLLANTDVIAAPAGSIPGRTTQPVARGGFITIFCTGLGDVTNRPASGAAAGSSPLSTTANAATATVGGVNAPVDFSGLAPGFVGLYQVNARVPTNAPAGAAIPVRITIGGLTSNTVTIAVQ